MKNHCRGCNYINTILISPKEVIKQRGLDNITVEELVSEITPKGRSESSELCFEILNIRILASVPAPVKQELLQRIRKFLATAATQANSAPPK